MKNELKKIGKVRLLLGDYTGSDEYKDGFEEGLLDALENGENETEILEKENNWGYFYHLSGVRENIISWYPFKKDDTVLEIGAGCGAITGALCEYTQKVTALDLSYKRSLINAYRHSTLENLEIRVGNFETIYPNLSEKYDIITLIGVIEYANFYIQASSGDAFLKMLETANQLLSENGKILIAIENKMGLKYWAGCREDHTGRFSESLENYYPASKIRTLTKYEWENLLGNNGFTNYKFYYPYPDYKFMTTLYSDEFLPNNGDLSGNLRNFDASRFVFFDETKIYNLLLEEKLFPQFSNSFFLVIEKKR